MYLLIEYSSINIIITALCPVIFAGASAAIYKIIVGYFQKDKDKSISYKKDKDGYKEITYTGYSMIDVKTLLKDSVTKEIIRESDLQSSTYRKKT
jgi:hypothetical protein